MPLRDAEPAGCAPGVAHARSVTIAPPVPRVDAGASTTMPVRFFERFDHLPLAASAGALLTLCFIAGGSSQQSGTGVAAAELLAIPVLFLAVIAAARRDRLHRVRVPVAVAVLIALLPLLQLAPVPSWLWNLSPARVALARDLGIAGVSGPDLRWSLDPAATERDAWSMLPPIALFFAALATDLAEWRLLLGWIVALAAFSLLLAFAQMGVPQDSILNPFPQYAPALAGVFANKNHQAGALAIGLVLCVALAMDERRRAARSGRPTQVPVVGLVLLALLFALALPIVNSRAGVVIAMMATGALLPASGAVSIERLRRSRAAQVGTVAVGALLAAGIYVGFAWVESDAALSGSRWMLSRETLRLGVANAPLGSGFGSFVAMFQQGTGPVTLARTYINAAHDEYAQWWLEGGVLSMIALLAAMLVLASTLRRLLRRDPESQTRAAGIAAWMGVLVLALHSCVDYPLRTPALLAVFALLAGIAVAAAGSPMRRGAGPRRSEG